MKLLVNSISRGIRLYWFMSKFSVMDVLVYRVNSLVMGLAPVIWMMTVLVFLSTIFSKVKELGGWSFWEVVFLTGVHETIFLLTWATFVTNLRIFVNDIRTGRFDQTLLKPVNPWLFVSFRSLDFTVAGDIFNVAAIFFFSLGKLAGKVDFSRTAGFITILVFSYLIAYFVYLIFASLALFLINSKTLLDWISDLTDFDRYPAEIYPLPVKTFFTFSLPILFFAYIPTAYFLGKLSEIWILYGLAVLVSLIFIHRFVWQAGLRNYQSASS